MATQERIRINNQDVWIDGRWVGHISVSGNTYYGALPGKFFKGKTEMEVAEQIMAAIDDETRKMDGALAVGEVVNSPRTTTEALSDELPRRSEPPTIGESDA